MPYGQWACWSSAERQEILDKSPPPRSGKDVKELLSKPVILQTGVTIGTLVYDSVTGKLEAWGGTPCDSTPPLYSWDLATFFTTPATDWKNATKISGA